MKGLTWKQQECLLALKHWVRVHGVSPSQAELARCMRVKNASTARRCLQALQTKGRVRLSPYERRGIEVLS